MTFSYPSDWQENPGQIPDSDEGHVLFSAFKVGGSSPASITPQSLVVLASSATGTEALTSQYRAKAQTSGTPVTVKKYEIINQAGQAIPVIQCDYAATGIGTSQISGLSIKNAAIAGGFGMYVISFTSTMGQATAATGEADNIFKSIQINSTTTVETATSVTPLM